MEKIDQVVPEQERGDLLVFLSGMNEISLLAEELKAYASYTKCVRDHALQCCQQGVPESRD